MKSSIVFTIASLALCHVGFTGATQTAPAAPAGPTPAAPAPAGTSGPAPAGPGKPATRKAGGKSPGGKAPGGKNADCARPATKSGAPASIRTFKDRLHLFMLFGNCHSIAPSFESFLVSKFKASGVPDRSHTASEALRSSYDLLGNIFSECLARDYDSRFMSPCDIKGDADLQKQFNHLRSIVVSLHDDLTELYTSIKASSKSSLMKRVYDTPTGKWLRAHGFSDGDLAKSTTVNVFKHYLAELVDGGKSFTRLRDTMRLYEKHRSPTENPIDAVIATHNSRLRTDSRAVPAVLFGAVTAAACLVM